MKDSCYFANLNGNGQSMKHNSKISVLKHLPQSVLRECWRKTVFLALLAMLGVVPDMANEKVYLHIDQDAYFLGETMWFAAYVSDARTNRPSKLSKVLYVELLEPEGSVLKTVVCKIEDGRASGCMALDPAMLSGLFEVRAYTRFMCNWEENCYSRVIPIFDQVVGGNYENRVINKRTRPAWDIKKKVRKQREAKKAQAEIETKEDREVLLKEAKANAPVMMALDSAPSRVNPFDRVRLHFHGEPHQTFSLSVSDGAGRVMTNRHADIAKDFIQNTQWILSERISEQKRPDKMMLPEYGISLRGTLMKAESYEPCLENKVIPVANENVLMDFVNDSVTAQNVCFTSEQGGFAYNFGEVYGDGVARLRCQYNRNEPRAMRIDKWFSPKPKEYGQEDYDLLLHSHPDAGTSETSWDDSTHFMDKVVVKEKKRNYGWKPLYRSLRHIDLLEEMEWQIDNLEEAATSYVTGKEYFSLAMGVLEHYHLPFTAFRLLFLHEPYGGDSSLPKKYSLQDHPLFKFIGKYKELVIRTDKEICNSFSYANRPAETQGRNNNMDGTQWATYHGMFKQGERVPSMIWCVIPYEENKIPFVNKSPDVRYTKIHGYDYPRSFVVPDYSENHPLEDNRRTLYWNPQVTTDAEGNATVEFYNNSTCREIRVYAEGITPDGRAIRCEKLVGGQ